MHSDAFSLFMIHFLLLGHNLGSLSPLISWLLSWTANWPAALSPCFRLCPFPSSAMTVEAGDGLVTARAQLGRLKECTRNT